MSRVWRTLGLFLALVSCAAAPASREWALVRAEDDGELNWGTCPQLFPDGCQIAVLHGDPDRGDADVFLRVPGGYALPRHRHTSAARMLLVAGELQLSFDGQRTLELLPGTYAYGPPQLPHAGRCVGDEPCLLFIAFATAFDATVPASE